MLSEPDRKRGAVSSAVRAGQAEAVEGCTQGEGPEPDERRGRAALLVTPPSPSPHQPPQVR